MFETLLVRDRAVQALDAHVQRMQRSAQRLYGRQPPPGLPALIRAQAQRLDAGEHRLRVDARPTAGALRFEIETSPLAPRPALWRLQPLPLRGGYGPDKLVDRGPLTSSAANAPVALLVDGERPDADVLEAAWANVWLLDGDRLITPPCDGRILPGVTRARLIALAPSLGLTVRERPIAVSRLRPSSPPAATQGVMLTSSLQLAAPAVLEDAPDPSPDTVAAIGRIRAALLDRDWDR
ncbi:MAG TPA: aminotransferase class IV [Solirubrobacteraceae bacterium]|nr:aminotransferase class IV [Solirubrobacteraceae bacterium]